MTVFSRQAPSDSQGPDNENQDEDASTDVVPEQQFVGGEQTAETDR